MLYDVVLIPVCIKCSFIFPQPINAQRPRKKDIENSASPDQTPKNAFNQDPPQHAASAASDQDPLCLLIIYRTFYKM